MTAVLAFLLSLLGAVCLVALTALVVVFAASLLYVAIRAVMRS